MCPDDPAPSAAWRIRGRTSTSTAAARWSCSRRCATANPTAKLVFAGSRLQYGRVDRLPVAEDAAMVPTCVHAVHKSAIEGYLGVYERLYGQRWTLARITNPYGPGQPAATTAYGVINQMIHLALAGQTLTIYGDGAQQRDYLFIDDLTTALMKLGASAAADGRVYNVGSGHGTSLVDLARLVIEIAGDGRIAHVEWPELAQRIETGDFVADVSRLTAELDWRPQTALADGLTQDGRLSPRAGRRMTATAQFDARAAVVSVGRSDPGCLHGARIRRRRRGRDGAEPGATPAVAIRAGGLLHPFARPARRGDSRDGCAVPRARADARPEAAVRRPRHPRLPARDGAADPASVPADGQFVRTRRGDAGAGAGRARHRSQHLRQQAPMACAGRAAADEEARMR